MSQWVSEEAEGQNTLPAQTGEAIKTSSGTLFPA